MITACLSGIKNKKENPSCQITLYYTTEKEKKRKMDIFFIDHHNSPIIPFLDQ